MANILNTYTETLRQNRIQPMTSRSRTWFLGLLRGGELEDDWHVLRKDRSITLRPSPSIGKMYTFSYIPKHKKTLPYYDRYPLILLADFPQAGEGFYGLNLHYLRPRARAILLSKLYDNYSMSATLDENTRMGLSYSILKGASQVAEFKPTFKRYLTKHIKSSIVEIPGNHWETAVFLPTQRFVGSNSESVWRDSGKKY